MGRENLNKTLLDKTLFSCYDTCVNVYRFLSKPNEPTRFHF